MTMLRDIPIAICYNVFGIFLDIYLSDSCISKGEF